VISAIGLLRKLAERLQLRCGNVPANVRSVGQCTLDASPCTLSILGILLSRNKRLVFNLSTDHGITLVGVKTNARARL